MSGAVASTESDTLKLWGKSDAGADSAKLFTPSLTGIRMAEWESVSGAPISRHPPADGVWSLQKVPRGPASRFLGSTPGMGMLLLEGGLGERGFESHAWGKK